MKRERSVSILFVVAASVIVLCGLLLYFHVDMTGHSYADIVAYKQANPHKKVTYTVTISGGEEPLEIDEKSTQIVLETGDQCYSIAQQAQLLPPQLTIALDFIPNEDELLLMLQSFPEAELVYSGFTLDGTQYPADCTELDLSGMSSVKISRFLPLIKLLPTVEAIQLMDSKDQCSLTLDEVLQLQEECPHLLLRYSFTLFDQTVTTETESLMYKNIYIGNRGLDEFRRIMPIMKKLNYLRLDTCQTSNEATAQLREDLAPQCKVVWRVFFGQNDALTDTFKIWATWNLNTDEVANLKYFNEVKYLDLGHNHFDNLDFMAYMPDVESAIVAMDHTTDISGIANCTKLEFLEIFTNVALTDEDMQHLSGLVNMKYLNISNLPKIRDLSFTDNMPELRWLWCTMSYVPRAEIDRVQALHPDCKIVYIYFTGDPTDYGWRYVPGTEEAVKSSVYALLTARMGYETWDLSKGEKGYLREEITFESLGLTPP